MSQEEWLATEKLFKELEILSPEEQERAFERSDSPPSVIARVRKMLYFAQHPDNRIEDSVRLAVSGWDASLALGQKVGSYRIVKVLGQGGMGTVYLGQRYDQEFRHQVAIKFVRAGQASGSAQDLFLRERQILAELEHPYICRFLDSGHMPDGQIYLIMEFVEGVPIHSYCETSALTLLQRLHIFLRVASVIQALHEKLVVHCDLKPNNILIQASGDPKILDFGIARVMEHEGSETAQEMAAFTLDYSSPEQIRGQTPDVRTDIFSLGRILQQVLGSGKPHHQLQGIIDRATQPDPALRQTTVAELIGDVESFLQHRPVAGVQASIFFRLTCWLRRNAALAAIAMVSGIFLTFIFWREHQLRLRIENIAKVNQEVADFLSEIFAEADPYSYQGKPPSATDILNKALVRLEKTTWADSLIKTQLSVRLAVSFRDLGEFETANRILKGELAQANKESPARDDEAGRDLLTLLYTELGETARQEFHIDEAKNWFEKALLLDSGRNTQAGYKARHHYSRMLIDEYDDPKAEQLNLQVMKACEKAGFLKRELCLEALHYRARILGVVQSTAAATQQFEQALAIQRQELGPKSLLYLETLSAYIGHLRNNNQYEGLEAKIKMHISLVQEIHLPGHPSRNRSLNVLANLYHDLARYDEAIAVYRRALDETAQSEHLNSFPYAAMLNNLALVYLEQENDEEAQKILEEALRMLRKIAPDNFRHVSYALHQLGSVALLRGNLDQARSYLEQALELRKNVKENFALASSYEKLALLAVLEGKPAKGREMMAMAWQWIGTGFLDNSPDEAEFHATEALIHHKLGDQSAALESTRKALEIIEKRNSRDHPLYGRYLLLKAEIGRNRKDLEMATVILERHLKKDGRSLTKARLLARSLR